MSLKVTKQLIIPAIAFLLFLSLVIWSTMFLPESVIESPDLKYQILSYSVKIGFWLSLAALLNGLLLIFFWEGIVAKSIKGIVPKLLIDFSKMVVYLITIAIIISSVFEISLTGLWATSGVLFIVLGIALRNMILDLFTGLAVNIEGPYKIGDWIKVHQRLPEQNITGKVEDINWRATRIRTEDNTLAIIPNSLLNTFVVSNYWGTGLPTRFEETFCIDFSIPPVRVKRILLAGVKQVLQQEGFLDNPEPQVLVAGTNEMGTEYVVRYWITPWKGIAPANARDLMVSSILDHLSKAGVSLAYPKGDIYHSEMPLRHLDSGLRDNRKELLSKIELFSPLEDKELSHLADKLTRSYFRKDEILINSGDKGESMFILVEGLLDVYIHDEKSKKLNKVASIIPGQFFGEMSLLTGAPRSATVKAVTDSIVFEITKESMSEIFGRRAEIADSISEIIAERELRNTQKLTELTFGEKVVHHTETNARKILSRIKSFFKGD